MSQRQQCSECPRKVAPGRRLNGCSSACSAQYGARHRAGGISVEEFHRRARQLLLDQTAAIISCDADALAAVKREASQFLPPGNRSAVRAAYRSSASPL